MLTNLFKILGKDATSPEVKAALKSNGPTTVRRSAPSDVYYSAPTLGLEVLAENDQVSSFNVFVNPTRRKAAYSGELPFGIDKEMGLKQVKKLLGKPIFENEVTIKFDRPDEGLVVAVCLDSDENISFLQFTKSEAKK